MADLSSSFQRLAEIRAHQPVNPEVPGPVLLGSGGEDEKDFKGLSKKPSNSTGVSASFQQLLDQLIDQHVLELSEARCFAEPLPEDPDPDPPLTTETTEAATDAEEWRPKRHSLCRRRGPEVHASQILSALEIGDAAELMRSPTNTSKLSLQQSFQLLQSQSLELPSRVGLRAWLQSNTFELLIAVALLLNVIWIATELQILGSIVGADLGVNTPLVAADAQPMLQQVFDVGNLSFTVFFALDVVIRILVLRTDFWKAWMNYIDLLVSIASIAEVAVYYTDLPLRNLGMLRVLRIGKLVRSIRMIRMTRVMVSLQMLIKCLLGSANTLLWSFSLLSFFQCVAGMILSTLSYDYIVDTNLDLEKREEIFRYYGTFTRASLTMFEILFGNFGPPARVLVENVSEWFAPFFLGYRCVFLYATLNVINAVFIQQTLKTANTDEEIAFKQKEKDMAQYARKVKSLFHQVDSSGDGTLNLEEFAKLVSSPKLKFWMAQLELEYHDLLSLFEFLDNGDGQITLSEFIDGAARLRGGAKALDIWRVETKLEVLFEEVLQALKGGHRRSVQAVFDNSNFRHIKTNAAMRSEAA